MIEVKYFCDFFEWAQNLAMYRRRFRIPGIDDYQRVLDLLGYNSGSRLVAFRKQTAGLSVSDSDSDVAETVLDLHDQEQSSCQLLL